MATNLNLMTGATTVANTDKFFIETAGGERFLSFQTLKEAQKGYFKKIIDEYMSFDYEDLKALRTDGKLIAGQKYLLTDYQTVYKQSRPGQTPDYADKVSAVEALVLTAISTDEFSSIAYSPAYPQDVIWYNFDNELSPENTTLFYADTDRISKGFKGIIIRRIDTQKNIDYSYDWRTVKWWRNVISGIISVAGEYLTFRDLSNTRNVISGNDCFGNTFGNYCSGNTFGNSCSYNTFDNSCFDNTFGNSCFGNTFGNYLKYADVKSGFSDATVINPAILNKNYNHTFYIDSAGNKKCYCITNGAIVDVPLTEV